MSTKVAVNCATGSVTKEDPSGEELTHIEQLKAQGDRDMARFQNEGNARQQAIETIQALARQRQDDELIQALSVLFPAPESQPGERKGA
ncbi:MAG: hypothetical protein J2P57_21335 [Acidimicrobiaceae bacterium]|nr:hypothetical protein [Acidimicrobiaceae bacterium]